MLVNNDVPLFIFAFLLFYLHVHATLVLSLSLLVYVLSRSYLSERVNVSGNARALHRKYDFDKCVRTHGECWSVSRIITASRIHSLSHGHSHARENTRCCVARSLSLSLTFPSDAWRPSLPLSLSFVGPSVFLSLSAGNIAAVVPVSCAAPGAGRRRRRDTHGRGRALSRTAFQHCFVSCTYHWASCVTWRHTRERGSGLYFRERNSHGVILARRTAPR